MRKQILLCAAACFLQSVLLFSCQTERKANHSNTAAFKSPGKQDPDKNKTTTQHNNKTAPKNYYIANKNITKVSPKPITQAPIITPQPVALQPVIVAQPIATTSAPAIQLPAEKVADQSTNQVIIIIKDSVLPKDPNLVAVDKTDTIQFKETNKDELNEPDQVTTEDAIPLSQEEMDTVISKYAEMISVDRNEISNFNLYFFIDNWYGTKYKYGGTDSTGIDCSAFSQKLYGKVYGVEILRTARMQHKHCERIKYPDDASEGDLLFFRIHHLRVSHVGVYLANGYFVHSSSSKGVMISNLNNKYWRRRFAGCGRIPHEEKSISESDYIQ